MTEHERNCERRKVEGDCVKCKQENRKDIFELLEDMKALNTEIELEIGDWLKLKGVKND